MHGEDVLSVQEILVNSELVRDERILTLADPVSVQEILCKAVHALEYEVHVFLFLRTRKARFVPPFVALKPLCLLYVFAHIKVGGKIPLSREIQLRAAGHLCGERDHLTLGRTLFLSL